MTRVTRAPRLLREPRGLTRAFARAHGPVHYGRGKRTGRSIKSAHTAALPAPPPPYDFIRRDARVTGFFAIKKLSTRSSNYSRLPFLLDVRWCRRRVRRDRFLQNRETIVRSLGGSQRRRVIDVIGNEHRSPTSFTGRGGNAIPLGTSLVTKLNRRGSRRRDNQALHRESSLHR